MSQLLEICTDKLCLSAAGRRVFLDDGTEVFTPAEIPREAEVYVSMGECFKDPFRGMKGTHIGALCLLDHFSCLVTSKFIEYPKPTIYILDVFGVFVYSNVNSIDRFAEILRDKFKMAVFHINYEYSTIANVQLQKHLINFNELYIYIYTHTRTHTHTHARTHAR